MISQACIPSPRKPNVLTSSNDVVQYAFEVPGCLPYWHPYRSFGMKSHNSQ